MENDKFQDFIGEQFSKLFVEFQGLKSDVSELRNEMTERFDSVDEQIAKLGALDHSDIEQVARQVEQLVVGQESLQEGMNTLLDSVDLVSGKTFRLERDVRELKKAK